VHVEGDTKNVVYTYEPIMKCIFTKIILLTLSREKSLLKEELEKLGKKETIGDYVATQLNGKLVDFWDKTMTIGMCNCDSSGICFSPLVGHLN
jgi:hypothetical protein